MPPSHGHEAISQFPSLFLLYLLSPHIHMDSCVTRIVMISMFQCVLQMTLSWGVPNSVAKDVFQSCPTTTPPSRYLNLPLHSLILCVCVCVCVLQSALCRSSQPLAGLMGRSQEDEEMIQCILKASPNTSTLHVMDTRPRVIPPLPSLYPSFQSPN